MHKTRQFCLVSTGFQFATVQSQKYWGVLNTWKLETGSRQDKLSCLVSSCVHTADADTTKQSCLVCVGSVNKLPNFLMPRLKNFFFGVRLHFENILVWFVYKGHLLGQGQGHRSKSVIRMKLNTHIRGWSALIERQSCFAGYVEGQCACKNPYLRAMCSLERIESSHYCHDVRPSICLSGTGVHCDHMLHVNADLNLCLDSPVLWAPWHQSMSNSQPSFSSSTWKRGGVWMLKLGMISQERLKIEVKLLLSANRESCMLRRLAQQRMTLSDLELPFRGSASRAISGVAELLVTFMRFILFYCNTNVSVICELKFPYSLSS